MQQLWPMKHEYQINTGCLSFYDLKKGTLSIFHRVSYMECGYFKEFQKGYLFKWPEHQPQTVWRGMAQHGSFHW